MMPARTSQSLPAGGDMARSGVHAKFRALAISFHSGPQLNVPDDRKVFYQAGFGLCHAAATKRTSLRTEVFIRCTYDTSPLST